MTVTCPDAQYAVAVAPTLDACPDAEPTGECVCYAPGLTCHYASHVSCGGENVQCQNGAWGLSAGEADCGLDAGSDTSNALDGNSASDGGD